MLRYAPYSARTFAVNAIARALPSNTRATPSTMLASAAEAPKIVDQLVRWA